MGSEVLQLHLRTGISVPCIVSNDGEKQPLLLLHAWGESCRSFDRVLPLLSDYRVFAPDLRGHGNADKPQGGYSLADQADDAAAILDALGIDRAFVLGSSSGGYVAQQLALSQPERVRALVLVGSPLTLQGRPPFADEVAKLTDPIDREWVRDSLLWFPLLQPVPQWFLEDRIDDGVRMPAHVWKLMMRGLCTATPPTEIGTITAPTLVVWGAHDGLLPQHQTELLAARITGSRLTVYPDAGHLVLWEHPARVAADAASFFESTGRFGNGA